MKTVFIVDLDTPQPYNSRTLLEKPTGGTILAIINLAEGLSSFYKVFVIQEDTSNSPDCKASYVSLDKVNKLPAPDSIITIRINDRHRNAWSFPSIRARYPNSKIVHWQHITLHDIGLVARIARRSERQRYKRIVARAVDWVDNEVNIIGTSRFHEQNIKKTIRKVTGKDYPHIHSIYNPVNVPQLTAGNYDPNKIFYASNPERGLNQAIKIFQRARKDAPELQLYVTKPPYDTYHKLDKVEGLITLGSLPRNELFKHIQDSLLVLYPNIQVQECFGYIYAESNALATPVLAHDTGAAREILSSTAQVIDCHNIDVAAKTILEWRNGKRPVVSLKDELKTENVVMEWSKILK